MKKLKFFSIAAIAVVAAAFTLVFLSYYIEGISFHILADGNTEFNQGDIVQSAEPSVGQSNGAEESVSPSVSDFVKPPDFKDDKDAEPLIDAYKIVVDGDIVGIVSNEDDVDDIMNSLLEDYKSNNDVDDAIYEITKDIQIKKVQTFSHNITDNDVVGSVLSECMLFKLNAYELSVDGYHLGYYSTEQECSGILQSAKDKYLNRNMSDKNVESISFDRDFDINEVYILSENIDDTTPEDAVEKILSDRIVEKTCTVTTLEQFDEICASKNVNIARELAEENIESQGFSEILFEERLVNFITVTTDTKVTKLSYSTKIKLNTSLLYNVKRTSVKGVNGSVTTDYVRTYINGECVSTKESSVRIEPVTEVIEYGTKLNIMTKITAKTGLGRFIWPTSGYVTGLYGKTSITNNHTGIDIGASTGTPIYAAADGEIVDVGYDSGAWGNYVKIKHDSTYTTLYLHMSKYVVKKGQKVKQGDVIGYVGKTGYVTGSHCHFSILKNGSYVNPITEMYGYAD